MRVSSHKWLPFDSQTMGILAKDTASFSGKPGLNVHFLVDPSCGYVSTQFRKEKGAGTSKLFC